MPLHPRGLTPLHYCAANGQLDVCQLLLSCRAEIDARADDDGYALSACPLLSFANAPINLVLCSSSKIFVPTQWTYPSPYVYRGTRRVSAAFVMPGRNCCKGPRRRVCTFFLPFFLLFEIALMNAVRSIVSVHLMPLQIYCTPSGLFREE